MGGLLPKPVTRKEIEDGREHLTGRYAFGVSSMQGWRQAMEDAHMAVPDFDVERELGLFGVFDGHGGSAVAKVAAATFPKMLREQKSFIQGRYAEALYETFLAVDEFLDSASGRAEVDRVVAAAPPDERDVEEEERTLMELIESGELDPEDLMEEEEAEEEDMEEDANLEQSSASDAWANGEGPDGMGCTAVVALLRGGGQPEVFCANAGDSRCVLVRGERAKNMSRDHKPELKSERTRIHKAGGFISPDGRVDGNLNLSRSFGDFAYKKDKTRKAIEQKISAEAEVKRELLGPADKFLAIGCDGIFEKVSSQQLVSFLLPHIRRRRRSDAPLSDACSAFLDHNLSKNPQKEGGLGCDNMTLMVIELQQSHSQRQAMPSPHFTKVLPPSSRRRMVMKWQRVKKAMVKV